METAQPATGIASAQFKENKLSIFRMVILHLLPGALGMLLMLLASALLERWGIYPAMPVLMAFCAPVLIVLELGFLYVQGWRRNGSFSLQGIVLYRDSHIPWWKTAALALPILAWIALCFFIVKPPVNAFFARHFFGWMPVNFLDEAFLNNLSQYSPGFLRITVILAAISITLGGAVEELYFRGYLLPRMNWLNGWCPVINIVLFSFYHFWSPWENVVRLLALTPWIYATWRTRNVYLALFIHIFINAFSGISLILLVFQPK
jgi:membrane protease YdiL (CAAX protease family)